MPKARWVLRGTTANHRIEESSRASSQKNPAAMRIIIRMGSWAMVNVNMAMAGPKAKPAHPKNSATVIGNGCSREKCPFVYKIRVAGKSKQM